MFRQIAEIKFENKSNDMEYDEFATNLQEIANLTIPEKNKNIKINKPSCPWWDEDCNNQIKERKRALRYFKNNQTLENYLIAKNKIASAKRFLKQKKKTKFRAYCGTLNRNTNISETWNMVRKFSRIKNNNTTKSLPEKRIATNILERLTPCNINPFFNLHHVSDEEQVTFNVIELKNAIRKKKGSAPGLDQVAYPMINHLPDTALEQLVNIYNRIIKGEQIPKAWRKILIVAFPNPIRTETTQTTIDQLVLDPALRKV